jgi:type IV secretory pathway protease TraF
MLGKVVLGVPGDVIDWSPAGIRRNGTPIGHTRPIVRDHAGRPLVPVAFGRYVIRPGTLWLFSPQTARSLDSRYFGPVPVRSIQAVVVRLF